MCYRRAAVALTTNGSLDRCGSELCRFFSSSTKPEPLFLWLGDEGGKEKGVPVSKKLLLPVPHATSPTVKTPEDVVSLVNVHYDKSHFVGGMGEEDPGVWFATVAGASRDTLEWSDLIQQAIEQVKEQRHGIPFGVYTTGLLDTSAVPWNDLDLDTLQVSLFAASPKDYAQASGESEKAFGQICGFIAEAVEQGMAVEVGVLPQHAESARSLAMSLGARHVHIVSPST